MDGDLALGPARFLAAHQGTALHHQKHLVFMVVMMPDELALQLNQLPVGVVDFANNLGRDLKERISWRREFLGEEKLWSKGLSGSRSTPSSRKNQGQSNGRSQHAARARGAEGHNHSGMLCAVNLLLSGHRNHSVQSGVAAVQGAARAVVKQGGEHA
jgi:hypothetical protein